MRKSISVRVIAWIVAVCVSFSLIPSATVYANGKTEYQIQYLKFRVGYTEDDGSVSFGSSKYVETIVEDNCVLVDYNWLCESLGLDQGEPFKTMINKSLNNNKLYQAYKKYIHGVYEDADDQDEDSGVFYCHKPDVSTYIHMEPGSDIASVYASVTGTHMETQLGAKVIEKGGKRYVPLAMFLTLVDSSYVIQDGTVLLCPYTQTAFDVFNNGNVAEYIMNVVADTEISAGTFAFDAGIYGGMYKTLKKMGCGVLTFSMEDICDACYGNPESTADLIATEYLLKNSAEIEEQNNYLSALTNVYSLISSNDEALEFTGNTVKAYTEDLQRVQKALKNSTKVTNNAYGVLFLENLDSVNDSLAKAMKEENLIDVLSKDHSQLFSDAQSMVLSTILTYVSVANEINNSDQYAVDAFRTYTDQYNYPSKESMETRYTLYTLGNPEAILAFGAFYDLHGSGEYNLRPTEISSLKEKVELYDSQNDNAETNSAFCSKLIRNFENDASSIGLTKLVEAGVSKTAGLQGTVLAVGWDLGERIANYLTGQEWDASDSLAATLYDMKIEYDAETLCKKYIANNKNNILQENTITQYRQLLWVLLKSCYVCRMDLLGFYANKGKALTRMHNLYDRECEEIQELMAVLSVGREGLTQEMLDEQFALNSEYNGELLKLVKEKAGYDISDYLDDIYGLADELDMADGVMEEDPGEQNRITLNSDGSPLLYLYGYGETADYWKFDNNGDNELTVYGLHIGDSIDEIHNSTIEDVFTYETTDTYGDSDYLIESVYDCNSDIDIYFKIVDEKIVSWSMKKSSERAANELSEGLGMTAAEFMGKYNAVQGTEKRYDESQGKYYDQIVYKHTGMCATADDKGCINQIDIDSENSIFGIECGDTLNTVLSVMEKMGWNRYEDPYGDGSYAEWNSQFYSYVYFSVDLDSSSRVESIHYYNYEYMAG